MAEGFDYAAHRAMGQGNPDKALVVTFEYASKAMPDGTYKNIEMVRIWLGKNSEVVREVTEDDKRRFSERYEAFKKGEEMPLEGTPISQCAFATPADVSACKAERIFTLEQLAETPDERLQRAKLINLKYKSKDFLEARARIGFVGEMRDQIEALKAQVAVLKEKDGLIDALRSEISELKSNAERPRRKTA